MSAEIFGSRQAREIVEYVRDRYGDELEFLWERFPKDAVWRNQKSRKWYGLMMTISRRKLGFDTDEEVEIIDLRFLKNEARDFAASNEGILPGYHMNKNNWITIVLDGSVETGKILELLDQSYEIALGK